MTTRRNIFRILTACVAASALEVMGFQPPRFLKAKLNPAWENATYEERFIFHPDVVKMLGIKSDMLGGFENRRYATPSLTAPPIPKYILCDDSEASGEAGLPAG